MIPLRILRDECQVHTKLAKVMHSIYGQEHVWRELLYEVDQFTKLTWNSLCGVEPTLDPLTIYESIVPVRTQWMNYRSVHVEWSCESIHMGAEVQAASGLTTEIQIFEQLLHSLKELIAITPP